VQGSRAEITEALKVQSVMVEDERCCILKERLPVTTRFLLFYFKINLSPQLCCRGVEYDTLSNRGEDG
jgi:hypothetical protein